MEVPDPHTEARRFGDPYTTHHPVPNIKGYKEQIENRNKNSSVPGTPREHHTPPETPTHSYFPEDENQNAGSLSVDTQVNPTRSHDGMEDSADQGNRGDSSARDPMSAREMAESSHAQSNASTEKEHQKDSGKDEKGSGKDEKLRYREVTDPVTHLPVNIHDFTTEELGAVTTENEAEARKQKLSEDDEVVWSQSRHDSMSALIEEELKGDQQQGSNLGWILQVASFILAGIFVNSAFERIDLDFGSRNGALATTLGKLASKVVLTIVVAVTMNKFLPQGSPADQPRNARESKETDISQKQQPETAAWLNNTLASIWPLVNPDLFISLADMLEDVMQASLPKLVKMVRIADLGQGNEPVRILGVRWLREGAASEDRNGMKAEEGDFINLEIALVYRSRPSTKTVSSKVKNAHLLLEFYLAGAIPFPVWVELKGMIGTCRVRIQTTPDPPFFSVMTFTFLGQPKVTLKCVPLMKGMPNIMDVPLISSFVQSSVDAAMSEYVAPKSLSLDLKQTLMGDDFKRDVNGKGVLVIRIISAHDFKNGDGVKASTDTLGKMIGLEGESGSDGYVALSWSKYGKSLWLTRVITKCQTPVWNETAAMVVGPEELNADEKLQLTLWDSDRLTADDHLGTIQVDLKDLLHENKSGELTSREDSFNDKDGEGKMPGTLKWEVGWFPKTKLIDSQVRNSKAATVEQKEDPSQVERDVEEAAIRKTREATLHRNEKDETAQQRDEDMKEIADDIMNTSPPLQEFPSGILSIQIHQISSLGLDDLGVDRKHHNEDSEQQEEGSDLPSAYCVITLNHRKIYKTRVKPKSSMPFFNAATERFIKDWRTTEVIVSVHDNRLHENNPILGCVVLPLHNVFKKGSQTCQTYPLVGGLGYGRIRISLVFRSVTCKLPKELTGWEVGTIAIDPEIIGSNLPEELCNASRISITSNHKGKSKLPRSNSEKGVWKREKPIRLAVKQRYSSHLLFAFRKNRLGADSTMAFAILWLKDIPDDDDCDLELPVWDNDGQNIVRAEQNAQDEYGEKLGTIKLRLRFWSGLSGYHTKLAKDDDHMSTVMEILDCASEGKELRDDVSSEYDGSSSSSESSSDEELEESGERGLRKDVKEYKKNRKELHRHHRGLMQWKAVRGINWAKDQVKETAKDTVQKVTARDAHEAEKNRIETEV